MSKQSGMMAVIEVEGGVKPEQYVNPKTLKELDLRELKTYCLIQLHNGRKTVRGYIDDPLF